MINVYNYISITSVVGMERGDNTEKIPYTQDSRKLITHTAMPNNDRLRAPTATNNRFARSLPLPLSPSP